MSDLFDGAYPDPIPEQPPEGLGADARRTWRQKRQLDAGVHPATGGPLLAPPGPTCGGCAHLWPKFSRGWSGWKCHTAASITRGVNDGPDMRKWWPACVSYSPKPLP